MKPIPVVFHIGPLQIHTYGIGLAITFWFAYRYFIRRLRNNGYPTQWLATAFVWIIVASIVGARAVHVIANWGPGMGSVDYSHHLSEIPLIWHGGLSSFGGLGLGLAVGIWQTHRGCPELKLGRALDLVAPVLMAAWAMGRLLGPQLMVNGGGHPCKAWYCVQYATGITTPNGAMTYTPKELPAPVFQAIESFVVFVILLYVEKWAVRHAAPDGMVLAGLFAFWGLARFFDEFLWLDVNPPFDAVEVTGIVLCAGGFLAMFLLWRHGKKRSNDADDAEALSSVTSPAADQAAAIHEESDADPPADQAAAVEASAESTSE